MPAVNIIISEADHKKLQDDYEKMSNAWAQQGRQSLPPPFEHWAGIRMMAASPISAEEVDHVRLFTAIEKLVTSLHLHGFCLAHVTEDGTSPAQSSQQLAQSLATHFDLPPQYVRRLQDVFDYYQKKAGSPMEPGQAGLATSHSTEALEAAYQELLDRTTKSLDHLDAERSIGRIEGALALLVSRQVLKREIAREKTAAFKLQVRSAKKLPVS